MPVGLGYRFLDGHDPLPDLHSLMAKLETRFTWRVQDHRTLPERILHYADGVLSLKEVEYLGTPASGTYRERAANLMEQILVPIESRRLKSKHSATVPERVKDLRHACLETLRNPENSPGSPENLQVRRDIDDLFLVIQIFSYPADYMRLNPTVERLAETLMKAEEDFLDVDQARPRSPRRANGAFRRADRPDRTGQRPRPGPLAPARPGPDRGGRGRDSSHPRCHASRAAAARWSKKPVTASGKLDRESGQSCPGLRSIVSIHSTAFGERCRSSSGSDPNRRIARRDLARGSHTPRDS